MDGSPLASYILTSLTPSSIANPAKFNTHSTTLALSLVPQDLFPVVPWYEFGDGRSTIPTCLGGILSVCRTGDRDGDVDSSSWFKSVSGLVSSS